MFTRLPAARINKPAWDACVQQDPAGVVYALSWYLDLIAPDWEGLVAAQAENYRLVMPLPTRRLAGLAITAMPLFGQQLGIFTSEPEWLQKNLRPLLALAFPPVRPVQHYAFRATDYRYLKALLPLAERTNLILPLHQPYADIYAGYQINRRRDLQKATAAQLIFREGEELGSAIYSLLKENLVPRLSKKQQTGALKQILALMEAATARGRARLVAAYLPDEQLVAGVFFLRYQNRLIYLLPAANARGKKVGASTFLLDQVCRQAAGSGLILDFEGSSLPGVARFYQSWGAQPEIYGLLEEYRCSLFWHIRQKIKNCRVGPLG